MKYKVVKTGAHSCHITLVPETDIEQKLLVINDENDEDEKAFTFQVHYQNAITQKIGPKAHLVSVDKDAYPVKVFAGYVFESSIGNI